MFGIDINILMFIGLAAIAAGLLLYAVLYTAIERDKKTSERMKSLQTDPKVKAAKQAKQIDEKTRRKMREEALKSVDSQRSAGKATANPGLAARLVQAGLKINTKQFYLMSAVLGLLSGFAVYTFLMQNIFVAVGAGFAPGFGLPQWIVNYKRASVFEHSSWLSRMRLM